MVLLMKIANTPRREFERAPLFGLSAARAAELGRAHPKRVRRELDPVVTSGELDQRPVAARA